MQTKVIRIAITLLAGFVALTAIGGGVAILTGVDPFPLAWLEGTPFRSYTVPALLLAVVVGGSALLAAVAALGKGPNAAVLATAAGLLLAGYITVEILILKQTPPGPTWIEMVYFAVGLALAALGVRQGLAERHNAKEKG
jgi:hypothetical protein